MTVAIVVYKGLIPVVDRILTKIFAHINSVGKIVNKAIVTVLLTLVWLFVIMPYHIFMHSNRGGRWIIFNKTYSQDDFIHMG